MGHYRNHPDRYGLKPMAIPPIVKTHECDYPGEFELFFHWVFRGFKTEESIWRCSHCGKVWKTILGRWVEASIEEWIACGGVE
jgi:hypothetical protein